MKKQLIIIMILLLGVVLEISAQNSIGDTRKNVIKSCKENEYIVNTVIYKDSITYDLIVNNYLLGHEVKYFKNNICYKYMSNMSKMEYFETSRVLNENFGKPICKNIWLSNIILDNYTYYVIIELNNNNYTMIMNSYTDYNKYLAVLDEKKKIVIKE